jgi:U3 small nucleolar RNA-associated protein 22
MSKRPQPENIPDPDSGSDSGSDAEIKVDHKDGDAPLVTKNKSKRQKTAISAHDIQVARETAELFKSNIFKLQIDELVRELKLKDSHCLLIEKVLHKLNTIIQQIPDSDPLSLDDALAYFKNTSTTIPFPDPKPTTLNYSLQYTAPDDVSLVGSFGLKTATTDKSKMSIDVCLTMDKSLIQPKDYLNYRILYKQAFYLAYLAHHLQELAPKNNLPISCKFDYHNGNKLAPSLLITSSPSDNKKDLHFAKTNFALRILIGVPFGIFEAKKMLPDKNCIRIQNSSITSVEDLPPTPLYNASILSSSTYSYYLKYLYTTKKSTEAFKDAAALGKLWLSQRGFSSNINDGGFGHFELNVLMSALLQGGGVNGNKILLHGYSSYQLFKGTIRYLATQDICDDGYLSFTSLIDDQNSTYRSNGFAVPTIFDKNTKINLLWKMSKSSYSILKKYAIETLDLLNDVVNDRFAQIFLTPNTDINLRYDSVVSVPMAKLIELNEDKFGSLEKIAFVTLENYLCNKVYKVLLEALGDRVYQIDVHLSASTTAWPTNKRKPASTSSNSLIIGLFLNPNESDKRVTKGPLHTEKAQAEKFVSFWGEDKAQVRRYKDNTIQWSVLWDVSPTDSVVLTIVKFILDRHLSTSDNPSHILSSHIVVNSSKFTALLPKPLVAHSGNSQPLILPQHFIDLKASFDNLAKTLTSMDLPLSIRSVHPASPALRNTSVLLPVPFATANPDFFNSCIIQFETSTRWPDELAALEDTKTAFLLKLCTQLLDQHRDVVHDAYVVQDPESVPYNKNITILKVLTTDGYGFSLRVVTEIDEALYLRAIENAAKATSGPSQTSATELAYIRFMQKYISAVKHHRSVSVLVTHFPYYSATVRLFKLWLDAQMVLTHIPEEVVELIVLHAFVNPAPYGVPASVMAGFLRVLKYLGTWNWREDPLILDLSREFATKYNEVKESYVDKISDKMDLTTFQIINKSFTKLREHDPHGTRVPYFIATKEDVSGKVWTQGISLVIASRLTSLSRVALDVLSRDVSEQTLKLLFTPALKDYDIVIKFDGEKSTLSSKKLRKASGIMPNTVKFKNLVTALSTFEDARSSADPVLNYYRDLVSRFGEVIVWSVRRVGGVTDGERVVTGLIVPGNEFRKFRVGMGYPFRPTMKDGKEVVQLDVEDVLKQCTVLGGDMIKSVDLKK